MSSPKIHGVSDKSLVETLRNFRDLDRVEMKRGSREGALPDWDRDRET